MSFESPQVHGIHPGKDVEQAIRDLSPGDFKKLRAASYALMRGLGLETAGRDHEDLYAEALARTFAGSRRWRRRIDFVHHLVQTMRSIAWTWREAEDRRLQAGLVPLPPGLTHDGEDESIPIEPTSREPDVERAFYTSAELNRFLRKFWHDRDAMTVIDGWRAGKSMKEMAQGSAASAQDLQWAARRIRRFAQKTAQVASPPASRRQRNLKHPGSGSPSSVREADDGQ